MANGQRQTAFPFGESTGKPKRRRRRRRDRALRSAARGASELHQHSQRRLSVTQKRAAALAQFLALVSAAPEEVYDSSMGCLLCRRKTLDIS